ncbi:DUF262 domain-containing protein [Sphaerisporangium sp. B11E5]|uniref:GmrSD restriction endonuclease domain-containing protein n=1 Tax=Sphaerisporangium sp. B11E5 TaxID=3153563 RepID=UPI00325DED28
MKANETTLRGLIGGDKQLLVPLYQRPYSWERGQLATLWRDIALQAERLEHGRDNSHFLGSVVLAPGPDNSPENSQWLVVDGQQRLTTLMVALCALRDYQMTEDPLARDRVNETHLINRFRPGDMRYRLLPTQVDRQAFKDCVEGLPFGDTTSLIAGAYRFFRTMLTEVDDPADPHDIARIESVVLNRLNLVQIVVEGDDNAFRIFESINNTGMRLSQVDLIRNYVFMHLPTMGQFVYDTYWLPMQHMLGAKGMDQLMYLALVLDRGDEAQYNDTYRGHQELLREATSDRARMEERVEAYVKDLARRARYLRRMLEPAGNSEIDARLRFLNDWKGNTAYPVVMRLLELHDAGAATEEEVVEAQRYIESFLVRRLVGGVTTGSLNRIFMRLTPELTEDAPVADVVRRGLSPARLYWSPDEQFRADIRNRAFYWQGRAAQQKLVLRRLEESFGGKEPVELSDKRITIEHVLPQSLTDEWREMLAQEGDADRLHKELVHTLGNLTLSGYNSELSNIPFAEKRDLLRHSGITMNQDIARQERWSRAEIQARADELASRAIGIWPGPVDAGPAGPSRDWTLLHSALAALPPGTWTTYGDLAELIGSHAVPVGAHLSGTRVFNAHRVLNAAGQVAERFRWPDEHDDRDVRDVLRAEGVRLNPANRADPAQRISARELAELLELPMAVDLTEAELAGDDGTPVGEHEQRFFQQLGDEQGPQTAGAVSRLLDWWRGRGGEVQFGRSASASCAPVVKRGKEMLAFVRFYTRTVEVPFATLKRRPPFVDPLLRDELRRRLNEAPGIDLPAAKLELYPSFPIDLMADEAVWDVVIAVLDWCAGRAADEAGPG